MANVDVTALLAGILGSIAAVSAVLALDLLRRRRHCPDCGSPLPKLHRLVNERQRRSGGWTCARCACEVSLGGQKVLA